MKDWLFPGARVVCVDAEWRGGGWQVQNNIPCPLREGAIYTIRRVFMDRGNYIDGTTTNLVVVLEEVRHPSQPGRSTGFDARRFRPLQKRSTDISVFTRLLVSPEVREDA